MGIYRQLDRNRFRFADKTTSKPANIEMLVGNSLEVLTKPPVVITMAWRGSGPQRRGGGAAQTLSAAVELARRHGLNPTARARTQREIAAKSIHGRRAGAATSRCPYGHTTLLSAKASGPV